MLDFIRRLNALGERRTPFFFVIDFNKEEFEIHEINKLPHDIFFSIEGMPKIQKKVLFQKHPICFFVYKNMFDRVRTEIECGNTYLLNLTASTPIECDSSLLEIYQNSSALFKLYFKDRFVSFSPERFVRIRGDFIHTYPMKGTINALLPNAKESILADKKELAEHTMIVDLLRNDLGMVAKNINVTRFRYITEVASQSGKLLQVSSEIRGFLGGGWHKKVGEILYSMLPAGSVSGTPKKKSCEIIERVELHKRGYFCGVFGVYDGESLDSGVLIRFIEKHNGMLIYKSGGGITSDSDAKMEYKEMTEKVYVPIF